MTESDKTGLAEDLLASFVKLASDWDAAQSDAMKANKLFDAIHRIALRLRQTEEGRLGIESLLTHGNRGVRIKAAGEALAWDSQLAIAALEGLSVPRGRHTLSAETTLREYRAGRLRFDW